MSWQVIFYTTARGESPVREFIENLPDKKQSDIYQRLKVLQDYGLKLTFPLVKKLEGTDKMWELRIGQYRIFYSPISNHRFLLIHGIIKKTQKTPRKDIELAVKRLNDFLVRL